MDLVNIFIARDKCHQTCSFHEASQHFPLFLNFLQIQQARGLRGPISDFGTYFVNLSSKVGGSYCGPCNILRVVCLEYKICCKAHTHQAVHITYFKMTTKSDDIWFSLYDIFTLSMNAFVKNLQMIYKVVVVKCNPRLVCKTTLFGLTVLRFLQFGTHRLVTKFSTKHFRC